MTTPTLSNSSSSSPSPCELREVARLRGHLDRVWHVAWSPNGRALASCSGDRTVRIWIPEGREPDPDLDCSDATTTPAPTCGGWEAGAICADVLEGTQSRTVRRTSWHPSGRLLAAASFDGTTCVWEKMAMGGGGGGGGGSEVEAEWEAAAVVEGHENEVKDAAWDASGSLLATCGRDKAVWVWEALNVDSGGGGGGVDFECAAVLTGHSGDVKSLAFSPRCHPPLLLSAGYDNSIRTWVSDGVDWSAGPALPTFHSSTVWSIAITARGDRLASGSADCSIIIWRSSGGEPSGGGDVIWEKERVIAGAHDRDVYSVDWSNVSAGDRQQDEDESTTTTTTTRTPMLLLASAGADNFVRVWDGAGGAMLAQLEFGRDVNAAKWHPRIPGLLAAALDDGSVAILRVEEREKQPIGRG